MEKGSIIIETGLILLIVFTSLSAFGSAHPWVYTTTEITLLLLVVLWFLKMTSEGEIRIPKTPFNIPISLSVILILLQLLPMPGVILKTISPETYRFYAETSSLLNPLYINSTISLSPYATKTELLKFLSYIGAFFLIVGNITTERGVKRLLIAIVITGFLISIFALIQRFTYNGKIYWFVEPPQGAGPFGPFINKNNFAGYINLIIPLSLTLFMLEGDRGKRLLFAFMGVIMGVALFFSLSRGGMAAFTGGMASMGMLLLSLRYKGGYRKGIFILGVFLASILLYLIHIGIGPVIDRLATLTEEETYLREKRWLVWTTAIGIIRDYPLLGTGLGTFEDVFFRYRPLELSGLRWHAHNDYVRFVVETGLVGAFVILSIFILFFKEAFSLLNGPKGSNYIVAGILSSMVAFMISSTLTFNTRIPASALLLALLLSILTVLNNTT